MEAVRLSWTARSVVFNKNVPWPERTKWVRAPHNSNSLCMFLE